MMKHNGLTESQWTAVVNEEWETFLKRCHERGCSLNDRGTTLDARDSIDVEYYIFEKTGKGIIAGECGEDVFGSAVYDLTNGGLITKIPA
jgi:hypothetical protein